ncbi:MAG: hypothetical protein MR648_02100 [Clostridiales bacterium]|nr:hypothetical protein [Clostridiales bacterium]
MDSTITRTSAILSSLFAVFFMGLLLSGENFSACCCAGVSVLASFRTVCTVCCSAFQSDTEYGHRYANDKGGNANDDICPCAVPQQHPAVAVGYRRYARCLYAPEKNADTGQKKQAAQCQAGKQPGFIPLSVLPCSASYLPHPGFRLTGHPINLPPYDFQGMQSLYFLKDMKSKILPPQTTISFSKKLGPPHF